MANNIVVAILIFFKTSYSYEVGSKNGVIRPILIVLNKTIIKQNNLKAVESTIFDNLFLKFCSSISGI